MGAQQQLGVEIKGVVHRPRGMMLGDVERFEVVIGVFDLRAFDHGEAGVGEQPLDTAHCTGHGVQSTRRAASAGQADVDALGGQSRAQHRLFQARPLRARSPAGPRPSPD
jgi:hypothetical protein